MAGHSQFKNIMHRKGAQDKKRAKIFTKIQREITTAVKMGGGDTISNPRLRGALLEAKENNMPKDNIERAIKKALGGDSTENYEEIRYEGYAPEGVAIIVEALSDNRNRTASEVRAAFTKRGGSLGENGSVNFIFDHVGTITYKKADINLEELFEKAIEVGAEDIQEESDKLVVVTQVAKLHTVSTKLSTLIKVQAISSTIQWIPKVLIAVDDEETATKVIGLISALEDLDDVQRVFANFDIAEDILNKISN